MTRFRFQGTGETVGGGGGWLVVLCVVVVILAGGGGATVAALNELAVIVLAVVGFVVVLAVAGAVWLLLRMRRRGDFSPVVRYQPQALPAPERKAAPPAQPAQQITNNFYGYSAAEVAQAVAEQQAINQER